MNETLRGHDDVGEFLRDLGARDHGPIVILAPHPDDEVFALGGFMSLAAAAGFALEVVSVTDGEASHKNSTRISPATLRDVRESETRAAYAELAIAPVRTALHLPDGGVGAATEPLRGGLRGALLKAAVCIAPLEFDGHPDHDATGALALELCAELLVPLAMYAVWSRFSVCDRTASGFALKLALDARTVELKGRAMNRYQSQLQAIGPCPEDGPVLFGGFLAPFSEPREALWKRA